MYWWLLFWKYAENTDKDIFDLWVDSVVIETLFILVALVPRRNRYWVLTQHFNSRSIYELNAVPYMN